MALFVCFVKPQLPMPAGFNAVKGPKEMEWLLYIELVNKCKLDQPPLPPLVKKTKLSPVIFLKASVRQAQGMHHGAVRKNA